MREELRPLRFVLERRTKSLGANELVRNVSELVREPLGLQGKELLQGMSTLLPPEVLCSLREDKAFSAASLGEKEERCQVPLVVGAAASAAVAWREDSGATAALVTGALDVSARKAHQALYLGNPPAMMFGGPHTLTSS